MFRNIITRIATLGLLTASILGPNTADAKAIINKPAEQTKIVAGNLISSASDSKLATSTASPAVDEEKTPISNTVYVPNAGGRRRTAQLASWYDPFINWLRNVLASVANSLRAGARSVREWMQRVADWSRNHLGGSSWVNVKGNGDCDAYVVPDGPVWGICHGHVNGSFDIEIHTK